MGRRRVPFVLVGALLLALCLPAAAMAAQAVTLDAPAGGSVVTTSRPTFSGTASTGLFASAKVTVNVYTGSAASGKLADTVTTTRDPGTGSYSVAADAPLPDGTYTARAAQFDLPVSGSSAPVTFTVNTTPPHVTLDAPGSGPLTTASPTLRGRASTAAGDTQSVLVAIFNGSRASGTPQRVVSAKVQSSGGFSATVTPALKDGQYTAEAGQTGVAGSSESNPVTFRIKVHGPALTLVSLRPGGSIASPQPIFSGAGGSALGDSATVSVTLHAGSSASGRNLGHRQAPVSGGMWSVTWPAKLATGTYTIVVSQSDDAGHTATIATTFKIVPAPQVIGSRMTISHGRVQIFVGCTAVAGRTCAGTVLALTTQRLQTRSGGPAGHVRILFAYVRIPGGHTATVRASIPSYVVNALRHVRRLQARITVNLLGEPRSSAVRSVSV